jgi:hypothetical protein
MARVAGGRMILVSNEGGTLAACPASETEVAGATWIGECEGFEVTCDGSRLGVVEEILLGDRGEARSLRVRGGLFGTTVRELPVEDVADVLPRRRRVVASIAPEGLGHGGVATKGRAKLAPWSR